MQIHRHTHTDGNKEMNADLHEPLSFFDFGCAVQSQVTVTVHREERLENVQHLCHLFAAGEHDAC